VSFVEDVRSELCRTLPARPCCRLALLGAVVRTAGSYHLHGRGEVHVEVDVGTHVTARRTVELARGLGAMCEIRSYRAPRLRGPQRFTLVFGSDPRTLQVMHEVGVLGASLAPLPEPPARILARPCCRAVYLRGAFLAGGSVSAPRRAAHLEIRTHDVEGAELLARLAVADGIPLSVRDRGRHAAVYSKRLDAIADLLARIGADDAALLLAEADVVARAKERANRITNCDAANLDRQVAATRRQLAAIERLDAAGELDVLPGPLRAAATLRLEHPDSALQELADLAEPPLAKPTLAARLRRLVERADDLAVPHDPVTPR
jgi:cell division protein WhiA